jgi:hypothetical protein
MSDVMPFGRYAGMSYEVLVVEDPKYVWLLAQDWLDAAIAGKLRAAPADWAEECAADC